MIDKEMTDKEIHEEQVFRLRAAFTRLQSAIESGAAFFPDCDIEIYPLTIRAIYGGRYAKAARALLAFNSCCKFIYVNEFQREKPYKYGCNCVENRSQYLKNKDFSAIKSATRNIYEIVKRDTAAAIDEIADFKPE